MSFVTQEGEKLWNQAVQTVSDVANGAKELVSNTISTVSNTISTVKGDNGSYYVSTNVGKTATTDASLAGFAGVTTTSEGTFVNAGADLTAAIPLGPVTGSMSFGVTGSPDAQGSGLTVSGGAILGVEVGFKPGSGNPLSLNSVQSMGIVVSNSIWVGAARSETFGPVIKKQ